MDPDAYLDSLEPIGWKLGLDRMHRLNTVLGMPQHRFASIHVVGTNGKSSVTRMTAALLEAHGLGTGACLSPHPVHWSERVLLRGEQIGDREFADALERVRDGVAVVDRVLDEGEAVTQFEVATAAAFVAFAAARVEVGVVEAGLGGRLDATNTIPSRVTVLTSVGLDHTEWLGETVEEIAAEKLAVLRDGTALVVGRLPKSVDELAERAAAEHGARLIRAPEDPGAGVRLRAAGAFQRRNFALATAAAEAFLGSSLDPGRVAEVAAGLIVPGRLEPVGQDPPAFLDAAHNPDGAGALAEALPGVAAGPVVACLAVLADKDAEAMIAALAPSLTAAVCTQLPDFPADGPIPPPGESKSARRRSWSAGELARLCRAAGVEAVEEPDFPAAIARGRQIAAAIEGGTLLVTGSHYVLGPARAALA